MSHLRTRTERPEREETLGQHPHSNLAVRLRHHLAQNPVPGAIFSPPSAFARADEHFELGSRPKVYGVGSDGHRHGVQILAIKAHVRTIACRNIGGYAVGSGGRVGVRQFRHDPRVLARRAPHLTVTHRSDHMRRAMRARHVECYEITVWRLGRSRHILQCTVARVSSRDREIPIQPAIMARNRWQGLLSLAKHERRNRSNRVPLQPCPPRLE